MSCPQNGVLISDSKSSRCYQPCPSGFNPWKPKGSWGGLTLCHNGKNILLRDYCPINYYKYNLFDLFLYYYKYI